MRIKLKGSKIFGILMVMTLIYMMLGTSHKVCAATVYDSSSDNTFATANRMNIGDTARGSITETDDLDNFKFSLNSAGRVTLNMTSYMDNYSILIFDSDGEELWYTDRNTLDASIGYRCDSDDWYLEKGTYYMQINGYPYGGAYHWLTGEYVCKTSFVSSNTTFDGDDNSYATAKNISLGKSYTGQISLNDDYDTYKLVVPKNKKLAINILSYLPHYCIKIFDEYANEIWYSDRNGWIESVGYRRDIYNLYLDKGTYYIQINGYAYGKSAKSEGKYIFSFAYINQSNCVHEYTNKVIASTYVKKGYTVHKCSNCGKTYKDSYTDKKKLYQPYMPLSLISGRGKLVVRWVSVPDASGYQIRYAKNKSMKKETKVKTVKGRKSWKKTLKKLSRKKKYYVQVRAYKKVGKTTVYSKWSKKKCSWTE